MFLRWYVNHIAATLQVACTFNKSERRLLVGVAYSGTQR